MAPDKNYTWKYMEFDCVATHCLMSGKPKAAQLVEPATRSGFKTLRTHKQCRKVKRYCRLSISGPGSCPAGDCARGLPTDSFNGHSHTLNPRFKSPAASAGFKTGTQQASVPLKISAWVSSDTKMEHQKNRHELYGCCFNDTKIHQ